MTGYVLIVDDDPDARDIQQEIVESLGLEVRTAEDGQQGLQLIYQSVPSLILLDIMMPKLNGFAVLAKLRSTPSTRNIPVIVVTACGINDRSSLMLPGVLDVVVKGTLSFTDFRMMLINILRLEVQPTVSTYVPDYSS